MQRLPTQIPLDYLYRNYIKIYSEQGSLTFQFIRLLNNNKFNNNLINFFQQ